MVAGEADPNPLYHTSHSGLCGKRNAQQGRSLHTGNSSTPSSLLFEDIKACIEWE